MAEIKIECQGLPCPQPVLKAKQAIDASGPDSLVIVVDNQPALENVKRFLASQMYTVTHVQQEDDRIEITGVRTGNSPVDETANKAKIRPVSLPARKTVIFLTSDRIGQGDDELGARLMENFVATLQEMNDLWRIIMVNSAVHLAIENSPVIEDLRKLESEGVSLLICGTCLDFFGILEKKAIGETTNMLDVVTSLQLADKVVSL